MRFIDWCRDQHGIRDLNKIDEQADELASLYLLERIGADYSAWTLQTERSALRMFFQDRELTDCIELPQRKRENIKRSAPPNGTGQAHQPGQLATRDRVLSGQWVEKRRINEISTSMMSVPDPQTSA